MGTPRGPHSASRPNSKLRHRIAYTLGSVEKALGPDHLSVAVILNNLGTRLDEAGQHAEAIEVLVARSLAIREKALGARHPDVAQSLSNLSIAYEENGDAATALRMLERAIEIVSGIEGVQPNEAEWHFAAAQLIVRTGGDLPAAIAHAKVADVISGPKGAPIRRRWPKSSRGWPSCANDSRPTQAPGHGDRGGREKLRRIAGSVVAHVRQARQ